MELPVDDPQQYESANVGELNKSRDVCCSNGHFFCWLAEQLDVVLLCNRMIGDVGTSHTSLVVVNIGNNGTRRLNKVYLIYQLVIC